MGTFNYNRSSNIDEKCLERKIIKVGDSIYLKIESVDQLASVIKFLDDSKLEKAMNELRESMKEDEAPIRCVNDKIDDVYNDIIEKISLREDIPLSVTRGILEQIDEIRSMINRR